MDNGAKWLGLAAMLVLAGCQTAGSGGVLGSVVGGDEAAEQQTASGADEPQQSAAVTPGTNPNAGTRLKNTRNALTDYCPAVRVRTGTETYRVVPKGGDESDPAQVRFQANITGPARECQYVGEDLQMRVGVRGRVITGPRGKPGSFAMPIRVAVTVGGDTVYSKLHRPQASVPEGATYAAFQFVDDQVVLPAPSSRNVRVFVGFDPGPYNTP